MIPKFRAWEKAGKRMVLVGSIDFRNEFIEYTYSPYDDSNRVVSEFLEFCDVVLMQSTGKMDSTGQVEVYAGDILYYPDQDEDNYGIIKFDEDKLAFVLDNGYERFIYGEYGMGKVIGNIYENPELVEG
ncbi:TPA: YopX family protein [Streptococcus suis]